MGTHLFADLPKVLQGYRAQIGKMASLAAQRAALAGGSFLAAETPVDTGFARSNWIASIDGPVYDVIPAYVPYPSYRMNHHDAVKGLSIRTAGRARVRTARSGRGPASFTGTP